MGMVWGGMVECLWLLKRREQVAPSIGDMYWMLSPSLPPEMFPCRSEETHWEGKCKEVRVNIFPYLSQSSLSPTHKGYSVNFLGTA